MELILSCSCPNIRSSLVRCVHSTLETYDYFRCRNDDGHSSVARAHLRTESITSTSSDVRR
jgi:hypothetical protein